MNRSYRGFSLVELLSVLAVTATLAGLAFAAWQRATLAGHQTACLNNLRSLGAAAALFSAENDGRLPETAHTRQSWIASLQPYLGTRRPYRCPRDENRARLASYAINDCLAPRPRGASGPDYSRRVNIPRPAETMFMAETNRLFTGDHFHFVDEETGAVDAAGATGQFAGTRHPAGANYLFVDGHVDTLPPERLARTLAEPGSAFLHPDP